MCAYTHPHCEAKEFRLRVKSSVQGVQLEFFGGLKGVQLEVFGRLKARGAVGNLRAQGGTVGRF